ncbi:hypothetical protein LLEC1_06810, partial [Akanthomyces lecanii]
RSVFVDTMSQPKVAFEHQHSTSKHAHSLIIRWNAARIVILFRQSRSCAGSFSVENVFLDRYNMHVDADIGRELFDAIAPAAGASPSSMTDFGDLDTFLVPAEHAFTFRTGVSGMTGLVPSEARPMHGMRSARGGRPLFVLLEGCTLPLYFTKDVRVSEGLGRGGCVARVQVNGHELCTKTAHVLNSRGLEAGGFPAQTPRTLGSIETPSDVPEARCRRWAAQVRETVDALHGMGVVWGNGKAGSVLVRAERLEEGG